MNTGNWQERAACTGLGGVFFGPDVELPEDRKAREASAKAICATCPVRLRCLAYRLGIEQQLDAGVWGGYDELERRQMRRDMLRAHRGKAVA
jgi:WhiB family redox-sensing transcriptional regulator